MGAPSRVFLWLAVNLHVFIWMLSYVHVDECSFTCILIEGHGGGVSLWSGRVLAGGEVSL